MTSDLQRIAQSLVECLDQVPQVVAYLQRMAHRCREQAAFVGAVAGGNSTARNAALLLDDAAQRCEEAAHLAGMTPARARAWAEQMVSGARTAGTRAVPGSARSDAAAGITTTREDRWANDAATLRAQKAQIEPDQNSVRDSGDQAVSGATAPQNARDAAADGSETVIKLSTANSEHATALSAPPPNATIRVDEKFTYRTDGAGRVIHASAVLDIIDLKHPRDKAAQRNLIGKLPGDHAGHIFARIFQGPIGAMNLTPMEGAKVNQSQYKTVENHWRHIIEQGETVEVFVSFSFVGESQRPDKIRVRYKHPGGIERVTIKNNPKQGGPPA